MTKIMYRQTFLQCVFLLRNSMESGVSSPVTPVVMPEGVISPSAAIGVVIPSERNKFNEFGWLFRN